MRGLWVIVLNMAWCKMAVSVWNKPCTVINICWRIMFVSGDDYADISTVHCWAICSCNANSSENDVQWDTCTACIKAHWVCIGGITKERREHFSLGCPSLVLILGSVWLPSLPKTKGTCEGISLLVRWCPVNTVQLWHTHETAWMFAEICGLKRWICKITDLVQKK